MLFVEISTCFFAALGIVYLLRSIYIYFFYKNKIYYNVLTIYTLNYSLSDIEKILYRFRNVISSKEALSIVSKVEIHYNGGEIELDKLKKLVEIHSDISYLVFELSQ